MLRDALFGGVAVVAILGVVYFLLGKWRSRKGAENREETSNQLRTEAEHMAANTRVGTWNRAKSLPATTQLFWLSLFGFLCLMGYAAYSYAQTGTPQEMAYASQLETALFSIIVIGGGIWLKSSLDGKGGQLQVVFEGDDVNSARTYYYESDLVEVVTEETKSGTEEILLLPLLAKKRTLGLFWKPMLVGDRPDLRDADHCLPQDRVIMRVPMDDSATEDQHEERITVRAKKVRTVDNPRSNVGYDIVPSDRKSKAEVNELQNSVDELNSKLSNANKKIASLTHQNDDLQEMVENAEHRQLGKIEAGLEVIIPILEATNPQAANALRDAGYGRRGNGENGRDAHEFVNRARNGYENAGVSRSTSNGNGTGDEQSAD